MLPCEQCRRLFAVPRLQLLCLSCTFSKPTSIAFLHVWRGLHPQRRTRLLPARRVNQSQVISAFLLCTLSPAAEASPPLLKATPTLEALQMDLSANVIADSGAEALATAPSTPRPEGAWECMNSRKLGGSFRNRRILQMRRY